jgi:putative tryptophan/tyrosine transport system substrate-binding protein
MGEAMRRRQFLALLGSMAIGYPADVFAQKPERMRRIGMLLPVTASAQWLHRAKIFTQALQDLGWTDGQNTQIDYRWAGADIERIQSLAKELVGSRPDVLVGAGSAPTEALQQATRTIPIVFLMVVDPIAEGIVQSLARPGGNATGFFATEPSLGGKWLELLKEIVPGLRRVAVIFNPETSTGGTSYLQSVETAAPLFSVEATGAPVHHAGDIELAISSLAREPGGGLIVLPDAFTSSHLKQIIELVARYRLPTIYAGRDYANEGGLMTYGTDTIDLWRQAASYVDQILKGANPSNMPVQALTKFWFVINLTTAKALGLTVPPSLLDRADELIE